MCQGCLHLQHQHKGLGLPPLTASTVCQGCLPLQQQHKQSKLPPLTAPTQRVRVASPYSTNKKSQGCLPLQHQHKGQSCLPLQHQHKGSGLPPLTTLIQGQGNSTFSRLSEREFFYQLRVLNRKDLNFCVRSTPLRDEKRRGEGKEEKIGGKKTIPNGQK